MAAVDTPTVSTPPPGRAGPARHRRRSWREWREWRSWRSWRSWRRPRAFTVWLVVALLGYVLAFALLAVSGSQRLIEHVVIVGALCLLAASIALSVLLRRLDSRRAAALRVVIPLVMLVVGLVLTWLWFDSGRADGLLSNGQTAGWGFFGACLAIMGAGHVLVAFRQTTYVRLVRGAVTAVACTAAV